MLGKAMRTKINGKQTTGKDEKGKRERKIKRKLG